MSLREDRQRIRDLVSAIKGRFARWMAGVLVGGLAFLGLHRLLIGSGVAAAFFDLIGARRR